MENPAQFDIGHPAPDRGRISRLLVAFGLVGAPLAWSLQLSANSALTGLACLLPDGASGVTAATDEAVVATVIVNLVALAVALLALLVARRDLHRTRHPDQLHKEGVLMAGAGRTRFLSVWGVFASVLFLIAIAANTIVVFWRGLCGGG